MANLFYAVFDGNLTADATFKQISDEKGVINFTLAHNFPTNKKDDEGKTIYEPQFYACTKWMNTGSEPTGLLENLKKGSRVTVEVQKIDISTTTQEEKKYTNINFIVSNIV